MSTLIAHSTTVVLDQCWCGIWFGMPSSLQRMFTEEGTTVWCPLGHSVVVKKTETMRLQEQNERLRSQLTHADDQRRAAERSAIALRGHMTRLRNRIVAGVCPWCHRTFQQVQAHVRSKHPDRVERMTEALGA